MGPGEGLRTLKPGAARGVLYGGCLSILVSLLGTPWEPRRKASCCSLKTWARSRTRSIACCGNCGMRASSKGVTGIVFGEMLDCASPGAAPELLEQAILSALDDFAGPIAIGLRSGHVSRQNVTLTFGVEARDWNLDCIACGTCEIQDCEWA